MYPRDPPGLPIGEADPAHSSRLCSGFQAYSRSGSFSGAGLIPERTTWNAWNLYTRLRKVDMGKDEQPVATGYVGCRFVNYFTHNHDPIGTGTGNCLPRSPTIFLPSL